MLKDCELRYHSRLRAKHYGSNCWDHPFGHDRAHSAGMATMSRLPELTCPDCGKLMELLRPKDGGAIPIHLLRVCAHCGTLAWNNSDGSMETRRPAKVEFLDGIAS